MSELINTRNRGMGFRASLLVNVSSLALMCWVTGMQAASADEDHPLVWIELGGQFERPSGSPDIFSPPFFNKASPADLAVLTDVQKPALDTKGFNGKITFTPEDSNWVFSMAARYGRSGTTRLLHHQTAGISPFHETVAGKYATFRPTKVAFADAQGGFRETHAILDFQAGKDVGLGLFGAHGQSVISAGVRFAQFTASNDATLHARPIYSLGPAMTGTYGGFRYKGAHLDRYWQSNTAIVHARRSSRAIGPSLSWDASAPVIGNGSNASLNFDWGANAAILFGRQRAQVQHQTTGYYHRRTGGLFNGVTHTRHYATVHNNPPRSRTAMIPNVGGFAGITFRYADAKISFGYRGDFFFNAMDGGIDTRKSQTLGFYGPFATVSIGFGG